MRTSLKTLETLIDYKFTNPDLLQLALTHCSYSTQNNERLEFLGDGVVNFVVAELLFHKYPTACEGTMSRWRACLVNRDSLTTLARTLKLDQYILLGQGELKGIDKVRPSILSCAMEAVIGAVYLDGGFAVVYTKLADWYKELIANLAEATNHKDPKSLLQEYLQKYHHSLPKYEVVAINGQDHKQQFSVQCTLLHNGKITYGYGNSRKRAEQDAAYNMLQHLAQRPNE